MSWYTPGFQMFTLQMQTTVDVEESLLTLQV